MWQNSMITSPWRWLKKKRNINVDLLYIYTYIYIMYAHKLTSPWRRFNVGLLFIYKEIRLSILPFIFSYLHTYIYKYVWVHVCLCICVHTIVSRKVGRLRGCINTGTRELHLNEQKNIITVVSYSPDNITTSGTTIIYRKWK